MIRRPILILPGAALLLALFSPQASASVATAQPAAKSAGHFSIVQPDHKYAGKTYDQWSASWWQWLYGTPTSTLAAFSTTQSGTPAAPAAIDCAAGQTGHVWFLAGTFAPTTQPSAPVPRSDVYRTCTVPPGKALFFPLLNDEFDNLSCDAVGNPTATTLTAADLTALARTAINDILPGSMGASVDGTSISGLYDGHTRYRAHSPWFSYTLPADNVGSVVGCKFPAGTMPPSPKATADGVYLMLEPLSPGKHVIHFGGETKVPNGQPGGPLDFIQNINYTITVSPGRG